MPCKDTLTFQCLFFEKITFFGHKCHSVNTIGQNSNVVPSCHPGLENMENMILGQLKIGERQATFGGLQ